MEKLSNSFNIENFLFLWKKIEKSAIQDFEDIPMDDDQLEYPIRSNGSMSKQFFK